MTLGDWIVWLTFAAGVYALGSLAWRHRGASVMSIVRQFSIPVELPSPPQSDAVDRPHPDDAETGSDWLDGDEMLHITKRELVHLMARIVLTDDDDRLLSQDIISRAAGIGKERAADMIRAARNQPDPEPDPSAMLRVRDQRGERMIPR